MQESHLFEYAVIRIVPRVEREEFLNVGVIVFCKRTGFLQMKYALDEIRLRTFSPKLDIPELHDYLSAINKICMGSPDGGPIARLDPPSRFRWLTAVRSTVVQASKVHPGLSTDLIKTLNRLHAQLVL